MRVKLAWAKPAPKQVWVSDTSELPRQAVDLLIIEWAPALKAGAP